MIAKGQAPAEGFAAAMAFNLAGVVGSLGIAALTDRAGWRWPLVGVYLGLAAAMAGLASAGAAPHCFRKRRISAISCVSSRVW